MTWSGQASDMYLLLFTEPFAALTRCKFLASAYLRWSPPSPKVQVTGLVICPSSEVTTMGFQVTAQASGIAFYTVAKPVETVRYILVLPEVGQAGIHSTTNSCANHDLGTKYRSINIALEQGQRSDAHQLCTIFKGKSHSSCALQSRNDNVRALSLDN